MEERVETFVSQGKGAMTRWKFPLLSLLTLSAIYLYAYPSATIIYGAGVLLHSAAALGVGRLARSERPKVH